MAINEEHALEYYLRELDRVAGSQPDRRKQQADRVVRRYLSSQGASQSVGPELRARLDARIEQQAKAQKGEPILFSEASLPAVLIPAIPDPAPLPPPEDPPPKADPPVLPPAPAPIEVHPEPAMPASPSADLGAVLLRALPAALSLYQVASDAGAVEEIADAIRGVARRAGRLARPGPLTSDTRAELCLKAREEIRCVLPTLPEDALETIGEIVIDAIDEHTDTGPLEEVDGPLGKRGLAALIDRITVWAEPDPGNVEALAKRARRAAERAEREADRLEKIAARKRARR